MMRKEQPEKPAVFKGEGIGKREVAVPREPLRAPRDACASCPIKRAAPGAQVRRMAALAEALRRECRATAAVDVGRWQIQP